MSFPGSSAVKNPPASAGDAGSIPGSGNPLEEEMVTHSSIAWEIPWTEEPGELYTVPGVTKSQTRLCMHAHVCMCVYVCVCVCINS